MSANQKLYKLKQTECKPETVQTKSRNECKPEIVRTQSWRYKTIVVIQTTISKNELGTGE